jgi:hypothetical protein
VTELENVRRLPRAQNVRPLGLEVGMQIWRDTSPHKLQARLTRAERRGEVARVMAVSRDPNRYGQYRAVIKRLRPEPKRAPRIALLLAGALTAVVSVGVMLYQIRYLIMAGLLALLLAALLIKAAAGHSVTCTGLHCPGCRG